MSWSQLSLVAAISFIAGMALADAQMARVQLDKVVQENHRLRTDQWTAWTAPANSVSVDAIGKRK